MKLFYLKEGVLSNLIENQEEKSSELKEDSQKCESSRKVMKIAGVALVASFMQACGVSQFFGFTGSSSKNSEEDSKPATEIPETSSPIIKNPIVGIGNPSDLEDCTVLTVVDLFDDLELATGNLVPNVKMYGTIEKVFLAMHFDKAPVSGDGSLKSISVLTSESRILALRGFTGADVVESNYRPFIMDNLHIRGTSEIKIIIELVSGQRYKFIVPAVLESQYKGNEIVGISPKAIPSDWVGNEGIADFDTKDNFPNAPEGFIENRNLTYDNENNSDRFLYTAQNNVVHLPASLLAGMELTDIMGNSLGSGASFTNIKEYQTFIAYRVIGSKAYRTIIKVV